MRFLLSITIMIFSFCYANAQHIVFTDLCEALGCVNGNGYALKVIASDLVGIDDTFSIQVAVQTIDNTIDTSYKDSIYLTLQGDDTDFHGTTTLMNNKWALFDDLSFSKGGEYQITISTKDYDSREIYIYVDETYLDNDNFGPAYSCKFGSVSSISTINDSFSVVAHIYDSSELRNTDYNAIGNIDIIEGPGTLSGNTVSYFSDGLAVFRDLTFSEAGLYQLKLYTGNLMADTITIDLRNVTTGLVEKDPELNVYPNPFKNVLYLNINSNDFVEVYTIRGELMNTTNRNTISTENWPKGSYILKTYQSNKTKQSILIKQ